MSTTNDGRRIADVMVYGAPATTTTATIANGASLSAAVDLGINRLQAIVMPAAWTTANLSFQASADGTTYNELVDDSGSAVAVTAAANQYIALASLIKFSSVRYLKVRSGTSGAPVNQAAERIITLVNKP